MGPRLLSFQDLLISLYSNGSGTPLISNETNTKHSYYDEDDDEFAYLVPLLKLWEEDFISYGAVRASEKAFNRFAEYYTNCSKVIIQENIGKLKAIDERYESALNKLKRY